MQFTTGLLKLNILNSEYLGTHMRYTYTNTYTTYTHYAYKQDVTNLWKYIVCHSEPLWDIPNIFTC